MVFLDRTDKLRWSGGLILVTLAPCQPREPAAWCWWQSCWEIRIGPRLAFKFLHPVSATGKAHPYLWYFCL